MCTVTVGCTRGEHVYNTCMCAYNTRMGVYKTCMFAFNTCVGVHNTHVGVYYTRFSTWPLCTVTVGCTRGEGPAPDTYRFGFRV